MHLFIDTTEYVRTGCNILHHNFARARMLASHGLVTILLPEITAEEYRSHLSERVKKNTESLINAQGKLEIIADMPIMRTGHIEEISSQAKSILEDHIDCDGSQSIPSSSVDVSSIVSDYFSKLPPFGEKKKHEFPDAIAVHSLVAYARSNRVVVTVVSNDSDFKRACTRFPTELRLAESLSEALGEAWLNDGGAGDALAASALSDHKDTLLPLDLVCDQLNHASIAFDEYDRCDAEVEDFSIEGIEHVSLYAVGSDHTLNTVDVSGQIQICVNATIGSDDPGFTYRDSDTKDFVSLARQHESVCALIETDIVGTLNLESLLSGNPEWEELAIATSGTLDMDHIEVESYWSDADSPDWYS